MSMSLRFSNPVPRSELIHGNIRSARSIIYQPKVSFPPDSRRFTRQEFKDECDINILMARYQSTGELPVLNQGTAQFLDVSASMQFQDSMNFIAEAQSMFAELPSRIRDRFRNDPVQFLDFCSNSSNRRELAELGLLSPEATREVLNPPPPTPPAPPPPKAPPTPSEA